MKQRVLGASGIQASVIGLGTWAIGGFMWGGTDEAESIRTIQAGIDAGINLIDTAPVYGFGRSEEIVGHAIKGRRERVVLATKAGLIWDRAEGVFHFSADDDGRVPDGQGNKKIFRFAGAKSLQQEVEASLRRLKTDYIDLYQIHWQDPSTPIAETAAALEELRRSGKIRAIGVCNATGAEMAQYLPHCELSSDQEKYSLLDRKIEEDQMPFCREHSIAMLAYSPMALGLLTGKITADRKFGPGDVRLTNPRFEPANLAALQPKLDKLRAISDSLGVTMGQLAVAWAFHQPGMTHTLLGARNVAQVLENAAAGDITLSPEQLAEVNKIFA